MKKESNVKSNRCNYLLIFNIDLSGKKYIFNLNIYFFIKNMGNKIIDFENYRLDNWKKMYRSARDLMPLLWYKKWERFLWVINKTIAKNKNRWINTDSIFFYMEPKSTWGRPRVDFELSKYACYLISLECDSKKEEVSFARIFFEHELRIDNKRIREKEELDKKIKLETKEKLKIERRYFNQRWILYNLKLKVRLFWKIILTILFLSIIVSFFTDFSDSDKNIDNFIKKDTTTENKEISILEKIESYIYDKELWKIDNIDSDLNIRNSFTYSLKWVDLIKSYFLFWNNWLTQESCSLLSISKCNSSYDLSWFNNFWEKTVDWYKISDIYKVNSIWEDWENIYCVKTSYKLKIDTNPNRINEVFQYKTIILDDWREEITSRICESITKWERNIKCPYIVSDYYCK